MSEMVERVARAIASTRVEFDGLDGATRWHSDLEAARAAIEAMREPIGAMLDAGGDGIHGSLQERWHVMIDAALKD